MVKEMVQRDPGELELGVSRFVESDTFPLH